MTKTILNQDNSNYQNDIGELILSNSKKSQQQSVILKKIRNLTQKPKTAKVSPFVKYSKKDEMTQTTTCFLKKTRNQKNFLLRGTNLKN